MKWRILLIDDEPESMSLFEMWTKNYSDYIKLEYRPDITSGLLELKSTYDLAVVDIQIPPQLTVADDTTRMLRELEQFRGSRFLNPGDPEYHPNGGFWLAAYAVQKLCLSLHLLVIYTRKVQVEDIYEPFMKTPALGLAVHRDPFGESNYIHNIIKEKLESRSCAVIRDKLGPDQKEMIAQWMADSDWNRLTTEVVHCDFVDGELRHWTLPALFPVTFVIDAQKEPEGFGRAIQAKLYGSIIKDLRLLFEKLDQHFHGVPELIRLDTYLQSPTSIHNYKFDPRFPAYEGARDLAELSLDSLLNTYNNRALRDQAAASASAEQLASTNWYKSVIELLLHWMYTRAPLLLLSDWIAQHPGWVDRKKTANLLFEHMEKVGGVCLRTDLTNQEAVPGAIRTWEECKSRFYDAERKRPKYLIGKDYFEGFLKAIEGNRCKLGKREDCGLDVRLNDGMLFVIVTHRAKGRLLDEVQRTRLCGAIDSVCISPTANLLGLRAKMGRLLSSLAVYVRGSDAWHPLSEKDAQRLPPQSYHDLVQPESDEYLTYVLQVPATDMTDY